jgi:nucleotide-binding universal stress UspA family protein
MKTIIVPVDFSTTSANAAVFACKIAAFYGADIWLYHTYELPVALGEFAYPVFDMAEMQKAADGELAIFKGNILQQVESPITIHTLAEMNTLQDGLNELCENKKPDLVVMGISGKNALTQLLVGSNTIRAIHTIKYPVLVIPPLAAFTPIRKIGFACDFEKIQQNTPIPLLKKIVIDFNADLHVLNVDFNNTNFNEDTLNERFALNEMMGDIKPAYHNIESEDITEGINWFANKEKLDIIVVIPKKHTLVQKMFIRGHTKDLLYHTHLPILSIHQ